MTSFHPLITFFFLIFPLPSGEIDDDKIAASDERTEEGGIIDGLRNNARLLKRSSVKEKWAEHLRIHDRDFVNLPYEGKTRWSSLYRLILRAFDLKTYIQTLDKDEVPEWDSLSDDKAWKRLEKMRDILSIFNEFEKTMQQSSGYLISWALAYFWKLVDSLNDLENDKDLSDGAKAGIKRAAEKATTYLSKVDKCTPFFYTACLTPTLRGALLLQEDRLGANGYHTIKQFQDFINREIVPKHSRKSSTSSSLPSAPSSSSSNSISSNRFTSLEASMMAKSSARAANPKVVGSEEPQDVKAWFANVKAEAVEHDNFHAFGNPIGSLEYKSWWLAHGDQFPTMKEAARAFCSAPPSSADCERIFSQGRDLFGIRRMSLKPQTVYHLMMYRDAMRFSKGGKKGKKLELDEEGMERLMYELEGLEVESTKGEWTRTSLGEEPDAMMVEIGLV